MLRFVSAKQGERAVLQDLAETLAELDSEVRRDPELVKPQLNAEEWRLLCRYGQRGGQRMVLDPATTGSSASPPAGSATTRSIAASRGCATSRGWPTAATSSGSTTQRKAARCREATRAGSGCTRSRCRRCSTPPRRSTPTRRRTPIRTTGATAPCSPSACWDRACRSSARPAGADLSAQGLFIPEAKTSAGRRHLELPAIVHAALDRRRAELDPRPSDYIWASAARTKRDRNNVRNRLLAPVLELGAQLLEAQGQRPLTGRASTPTETRPDSA